MFFVISFLFFYTGIIFSILEPFVQGTVTTATTEDNVYPLLKDPNLKVAKVIEGFFLPT
ncbi:hypothetical protein NARC_10358 [Candidatus Nitrosocosmicus arcticus]|uniref:Uncharacterized protein n=1 Tax=Candidatus Nitrosocosmicus arcticus TaxID=2035267 RepID=A0A557SZB9_9ARCH|nr:hypothetical protein NARC_10358 [Candidatus Nitrosocosmicus arcticus]